MKKIIETKVGVIGLGYVGKPLAYLAAEEGYEVIEIDNNIKVIEEINARKDIPTQINIDISKIKLFATDDCSKLDNCQIVIVCVPTPTKNNIPDLSIIENVVSNMKDYVEKSLIIVESTVAPGMTKNILKKIYLKKQI